MTMTMMSSYYLYILYTPVMAPPRQLQYIAKKQETWLGRDAHMNYPDTVPLQPKRQKSFLFIVKKMDLMEVCL